MADSFCLTILIAPIIVIIIAVALIISAPKLGFEPPIFAKEMAEYGLAALVLLIPPLILEVTYGSMLMPGIEEQVVCVGSGVLVLVAVGALWGLVIKKYFPDREKPPSPLPPNPVPAYGMPYQQYGAPAYYPPAYGQPGGYAYGAPPDPYPVGVPSRCRFCGADMQYGMQRCPRCGSAP